MDKYNGTTVGDAACGYTNLKTYNAPAAYSLGPKVAAVVSKNVGVMMVPVYSAPGYATLTGSGAPSCNGYFSITNAYGQGASTCGQKFSTVSCSPAF